MNFRQRELRKFYMTLTISGSGKDWLWYTHIDGTQVTLRYLGNKEDPEVPKLLDAKTVTQLECTTFYNNQDITTAVIDDNILKIN